MGSVCKEAHTTGTGTGTGTLPWNRDCDFVKSMCYQGVEHQSMLEIEVLLRFCQSASVIRVSSIKQFC